MVPIRGMSELCFGSQHGTYDKLCVKNVISTLEHLLDLLYELFIIMHGHSEGEDFVWEDLRSKGRRSD